MTSTVIDFPRGKRRARKRSRCECAPVAGIDPAALRRAIDDMLVAGGILNNVWTSLRELLPSDNGRES